MEIQVELLRMRRIGPARRDVGVDCLEREHLTGRRVKSRPVITDGPPWIRLIYVAADQGAVERRELTWVRAVQHDAFQGRERLSLLRRGHTAYPAGLGSRRRRPPRPSAARARVPWAAAAVLEGVVGTEATP